MTSELEALAASLSQTVHTLCTELRSRQLPHLSSERDPPNDIYTSPVLNDARSRILDLVDELQALVLGPVGTLTLPPVCVNSSWDEHFALTSLVAQSSVKPASNMSIQHFRARSA